MKKILKTLGALSFAFPILMMTSCNQSVSSEVKYVIDTVQQGIKNNEPSGLNDPSIIDTTTLNSFFHDEKQFNSDSAKEAIQKETFFQCFGYLGIKNIKISDGNYTLYSLDGTDKSFIDLFNEQKVNIGINAGYMNWSIEKNEMVVSFSVTFQIKFLESIKDPNNQQKNLFQKDDNITYIYSFNNTHFRYVSTNIDLTSLPCKVDYTTSSDNSILGIVQSKVLGQDNQLYSIKNFDYLSENHMNCFNNYKKQQQH